MKFRKTLEEVKKANMSKPVGSIVSIKNCSSSSLGRIKSSAVNEKLKELRRTESILEIRKKIIFLEVINKRIIYKFFKDFTNHRKKTNRAVDLVVELFPTFLNTGTTDETFQQSGKQYPSRHILKT